MNAESRLRVQILAVALSWRTGADETRREFEETGGVPLSVEMAALTMEACANRLERLAHGEMNPKES